jgi:endonuclease/exonuclease/phosphatase family metal-dependent hydrolase
MGLAMTRNPVRVLASLLLLVASGCARDAGTPAGATIDPLRVVTFNIRLDLPSDGQDAWPLRRDWVASVLDSLDADVIGLQEALVGQVRDLDSALSAYGRVGVGRDDGREAGEFSPLFYRTDRLELLDSGTIWLSATPDSAGSVGWDAALPRIATWARMHMVRGGREILVVNTHFDHVGVEARQRSAALLRERFVSAPNPAPLVLMGDFNVTDTTAAYRILTVPDHGLVDAWKAAGSAAPTDTFTGFEASGQPGPRIDFVFVSREWDVMSARAEHLERNGRHPSDHRPLVAGLRLR